MSYDRGGCLLCPEDDGAHPGRARSPVGVCRFSAASPCAPLPHPTDGADRNQTSARGSRPSPVRSASRLWPPDGTGALGLLPDASNPAGNAGDARQAEAGPRARARNYVFADCRTSTDVFTHKRATSRRTRLSVLTRSPSRDGNQAGWTTALPIPAGTGWRPEPRAQLTLHGGVIEGQRDSRNEERARPTARLCRHGRPVAARSLAEVRGAR